MENIEIEDIEKIVEEKDKLEMVKLIQRLGLDKNDELMAQLYAFTYMRLIGSDIPKAIDGAAVNLNELVKGFQQTLMFESGRFSEVIAELVKSETGDFETRLEDFSRDIDEFVAANQASLHSSITQLEAAKGKVLAEIKAAEATYRQAVDTIKKDTTKAFVEAIKQEVFNQTAWDWRRWALTASASFAGMWLFHVLKSMF